MAQWAYKVAYIDYRGRISSEGLETLMGDNERRSAFARRYLNTLGKEGWELVGIQPLASNSAYYVFKRVCAGRRFRRGCPVRFWRKRSREWRPHHRNGLNRKK